MHARMHTHTHFEGQEKASLTFHGFSRFLLSGDWLWGKAYSFMTDSYGIFNACLTHKRWSGATKSAHELTRRDRKTVPHPALVGDRTQGYRIRILMLYHWATSPVTQQTLDLLCRCRRTALHTTVWCLSAWWHTPCADRLQEKTLHEARSVHVDISAKKMNGWVRMYIFI